MAKGKGCFHPIKKKLAKNCDINFFFSYKLETITLEEISPEYAKVILKTFASSLKRVTFSSCDQINLMDLLPCRQLESLSILKYSTLEKSTAESASLSPSSFLPHLKLYKSEICLGLRSLWLEGKSELTHVALNCWHTGANVIEFIYF